jgi:hypothetical protein
VAGTADDAARGIELRAIRRELEDLVSARSLDTLSDAEQARYETLCSREQELLSDAQTKG